MYGDPLRRVGVPLRYVDEGDYIVAYDGNENVAGKINKSTLHTVYSTPSVRLAAGPYTTFLNLGTYHSLDDAKCILELQERAKAVPVFAPGRIVGWIDPDRKVKLKDSRSLWARLWSFIKRVFTFKKALT